jgi:hypothetical protein
MHLTNIEDVRQVVWVRLDGLAGTAAPQDLCAIAPVVRHDRLQRLVDSSAIWAAPADLRKEWERRVWETVLAHEHGDGESELAVSVSYDRGQTWSRLPR